MCAVKVRTIIILLVIMSIFPFFSEAASRWKDSKEKVGDIEIHYLEAGKGDRIIVFLTGWTLPAEVWEEQIPYFTERGFRVIAFDPRSQGKTKRTETGNTYRQHAADLYEFLLKIKAEHSFLVAWSSSVNTLLEYVSSPDSIRPNKIVIVDGFPSAIPRDDFPGTTSLSQAREQFYELQQDREKFTEKYIEGLFKQPQDASLLKDLKKSSLQTPIGALMSLFFDNITGNRLSVLDRIAVPTMIVTTREHESLGQYMNTRIPRSELTVIEEAGHAIFLDKPQAFNQALEDFIGEY
ncbi:MAG: alpha/beta hydrolase [Acidobacteriota bacterium]